MNKLKIVSGDKMFKREMKNPEFRNAYDALEPEFQIAKQVIKARIDRKLTQTQLAKRIGTKQPVISRLEGMDSMPTITLLKKVAESLGKKLVIKFV
ncbi:MAG: helix-turn-helix transcriptional regulator [Patescibacteria group bacterium]